MSIIVSSIVEVAMNKIALGTNVSPGDWTAERAIIASYVTRPHLSNENKHYRTVFH